MIYTTLPKETWTNIVSNTLDNVIVQVQRPASLQLSFGQPAADESGFVLEENDILSLNNGTYGEDLWAYCAVDNIVVTQNGNSGGGGATASSDLYTPTLTGIANVSSIVNDNASYIRIGNIVDVSAVIRIDPSAANVTFDMSLPISIGAGTILYGTAIMIQEGGIITSSSYNASLNAGNARFTAVNESGVIHNLFISIRYQVA